MFPDGIEFLEFDSDDIGNTKLSPEEIDKLPFGAIRLDASGTILQYNKTEGTLRDSIVEPLHVIGPGAGRCRAATASQYFLNFLKERFCWS